MKVLVVDDHYSNRLLLKYILEAEGHICIEAEDGLKSLDAFKQHVPDCILMDIDMPNMDGFEAAAEIKALSRGYHVPIVFLTAKTDEESILKCLEVGGDDYLPKPVNQLMLMAKIRAHARTQELTQQIRSKNDELTLLHATLQQEHEMGKHVINHTLMRSWQDCPIIRTYLSAVSIFNGDVFIVAPKPKGGLYAFLGDFTGHGLAAAIGTIPLSQVFFAMCSKGKAVSEIASAMNASLKAFLPEHMFCAATLIDLSENGCTMTVWSGGLPEAPVIRPGEGLVAQIESQHMPLGILRSEDFDGTAMVFNLCRGDKVLLMTDGILEGVNEKGEMYGRERLLSTIDSVEDAHFDVVLSDYSAFLGNVGQSDDISLAELTLEPMVEKSASFDEEVHWLPWQMSIELKAERLRDLSDPISQLVKFFPEDMLFSQHLDYVRTILSELFSNALEHGLLGLDSQLKSSADGFIEYYRLREERLANLVEGSIEISVNYDSSRLGRELRITFEDSGEGFDCNAQLRVVKEEGLEFNDREWGRGLALVSSLSKSLQFEKNGRRVLVDFELK